MSVSRKLEDLVLNHCQRLYQMRPSITLNPPRQAEHGDFATNAALVLSKQVGQNPHVIAQDLVKAIQGDNTIKHVEIAGPGFINITLKKTFWQHQLAIILADSGITQANDRGNYCWGQSSFGQGEKVIVEFVSANPTGPMHIGHARGAVVGDVLASLLEKTGHQVWREYYINDAGAQIDALGQSVWFRYRQICGDDPGQIDKNLYPGDYIHTIAQTIHDHDGDRWLKHQNKALKHFSNQAIQSIMGSIKHDLKTLNVQHDAFFSEQTIIERGAVEQAVKVLEDKKLVYKGVLTPPRGTKLQNHSSNDTDPEPSINFRAQSFGDDEDRCLQRSDGRWTYFASDIAYHNDKYRRGFTRIINIWGRDHSGYIQRVQSAMAALSESKASLNVILVALVNLYSGGAKTKMSKRSGNLVTLAETLDKVGAAAIRFMMLTRRADVPLDFDLAKAVEHSRENPHFYVQYAHARCRSVLRSVGPNYDVAQADPNLLDAEDEIAMIKTITSWPRCVEDAARAHEPHRIAYYLSALAAAFHALWTQGNQSPSRRFLVPSNPALSQARVALVAATALTLAQGLRLLNISPMEELRD